MFINVAIKQFLKKRMFFCIISSLIFLLLLHLFMFLDMDNRSNYVLDYILDNNAQINSVNIDSLPILGLFSKTTSLCNTLYPVRYFYAVYNEWGKLIDLNLDRFPEMNYVLAENLISDFNSNVSLSGYNGFYKYKNLVNGSGSVLVYLDQSINLYSILLSLLVSTSLLIVFSVLFIFTDKKHSNNISNITVNENSLNISKLHSDELCNTNEIHIRTNNNKHNEISIFDKTGMNKIVDRLLLISNLNVKDWLKPFEKFNFSDVILETVLSFQTIEEVRHKQIEINIQRNILIEGNREYLKKCIELMMDNAIKYSDDCGNIVISFKNVCNEIRLSIKNSCDLNSLGNLDLLFQPFYRRSCKYSNSGCNFGMGLAIVKKIIDAHDARISIHSEENFVDFVIVFLKTM